MKLIYLGGANEVGASSILMELDSYRVLLDCGIRQKKNKDRLPDFDSIKEIGGIDAIVISHAHMDHIGSLPLISKEFPNALIYMNRMTLELARVLLYDSLKIMAYQEGEIPIFQEDDVLNMFKRVRLVPYQKNYKLTPTLSFTFYMAGHIAGASCIYFQAKEGSVFYTGDYSLFNQHTVGGLSIPKLRPDVIISEATYGNRLHANRESEELKLVEYVKEIINQGGKVLIPVFALGRSQEVLLILKKAFNKKQLPLTKVYVDGMVKNINSVFLNNPLFLKESLGKRILKGQEVFYNDNIIRIDTKEEREKLLNSTESCIIVASSGMLSGGMSEYYATSIVSNEKNAIILTGYQDEEANGAILLNLLEEEAQNRKISLNGKVYHVNCQIKQVGLSAHADKQEMKQLFTNLNSRKIILGHGEESIIESFAQELTKELNSDIYVPLVGQLLTFTIKNPRRQINHELKYLYAKVGEMSDFYDFIKDNYGYIFFTKEDLAYIYYGENPTDSIVEEFTKQLIDSPYFTQDKRRYFLFKITDELELENITNKEMTAQDIEQIILTNFQDFNYQKISYFLAEKRVVLTFEFPKTIGEDFDKICEKIYNETGITVEKNDNVNNFACSTVINKILKPENVDKISYLPDLDEFKIRVYEFNEEKRQEIEKAIGYRVELVLVPRKNVKKPILTTNLTGEKLEQNAAVSYIDNFFQNKDDKPYKKSFKNGQVILSFITYEIACKYLDDLKELETAIGWSIGLNKVANMHMIFQELEVLLQKYQQEKLKNPSLINNKVEIKLKENNENTLKMKEEFLTKTGLELKINL